MSAANSTFGRGRAVRRWLAAGLMVLAMPLWGAKPGKAERREMKNDLADAKPAKTSTEDAASRALAKLREQFEVTDDAEWEVIRERISQVTELRRNVMGSAALKAGAAIGEKSRRSRGGALAEQEALRTAVRDKLPEAEIKARLARMHELFEKEEAKLAKAEDDLRAVLTIRQEAVAVVVGLLPP